MNNDKKKLILVSLLALAVVSIGAWQFLGQGSSKKPSKKVADAQQGAQAAEPKPPTVVADLDMIGLARKDPFQPVALPDMVVPEENKAQPAAATSRPSSGGRRSGSGVSSSINTQLPFTFDGNPLAGGGVEVSSSTPLRSPDEFGYSLVGVLEGPKPVAVFRGDSGEQRMVRLHENVSGDSRVVGISNGQVKVQHRGKTITLSVGGNG